MLTGDAPTTSEWSTILLPTQVSYIRGLTVYEWNNDLQNTFLSTCFLSKLHMLHGYQGGLCLYCWSPIWKQICIDLIITACITNPISPFHHFPQLFLVSKLPLIYWKASSYLLLLQQLSCGDDCQIWKWMKIYNSCCYKFKSIPGIAIIMYPWHSNYTMVPQPQIIISSEFQIILLQMVQMHNNLQSPLWTQPRLF